MMACSVLRGRGEKLRKDNVVLIESVQKVNLDFVTSAHRITLT